MNAFTIKKNRPPNEIHPSMIFPSIHYCHNIGKIIECEQLPF